MTVERPEQKNLRIPASHRIMAAGWLTAVLRNPNLRGPPAARQGRNYSWAELMKGVWAVDVLA